MTAGMLPIVLGLHGDDSFRLPMGLVVVGGLITSTILSLLVVPVVFTILDEVRMRVAGRMGWTATEIDEKRLRSEEHTSELQSLMRISYAVICLKKKTDQSLTCAPHIPLNSRRDRQYRNTSALKR